MAQKSIVLLSSGLDSTVALAKAVQETEVAYALTFDYGQRASLQEADRADLITAHYNIPFEVIQLPWLYNITKTALVNLKRELPTLSEADIEEGGEALAQAARDVWVPNRNGVFLSVGAAFAESMDCELVVTGFNAQEAATFKDNSADYVAHFNETLKSSTQNGVQVWSPLAKMSKIETVQLAKKLNVPIHLVWPCYDGDDELCGRCVSCVNFYMALEKAGHDAWYEQEKARWRTEVAKEEEAEAAANNAK